jgi:hypothetical protein
VKGKQEPVVSDEKSPWSRVVTYVRDSCLGAKDAKAAVRAFGRICPSGLEKNETIKEILRRPTSKPKQIGDGALSGAPSPTVPAVQEKSTERRGTGMTDDALLAFNPILKEAFDRYVDKSDPFVLDMMRQIVAAAIKTGAAPEKIYATIKTGRMLTKENMKFLSEADIKEWGDAAEEYKRLARQD